MIGISLRSGRSKSCGCLRRESSAITGKGNLIDLTGKRFGYWTVIARDQQQHRGRQAYWLCRCICDETRSVPESNLRRGISTSCGCFRREGLKRRLTTHGMSKTRIYNRWKGMRQRCKNSNHPWYDAYGARGIDVDDEWQTFLGFYNCVGDPPPGKSIDRIDNDGPYAPWNWRWADAFMQVHNRRRPKRKRKRQARP